jgi:hypothetical protein
MCKSRDKKEGGGRGKGAEKAKKVSIEEKEIFKFL